mmetsp:Transcript_52929/g.124268  ORF Transcript_52929/g.124268 Transcript_52929/m.124268 type:complete len:227 (-) Transcript_52929:328-1008(-)
MSQQRGCPSVGATESHVLAQQQERRMFASPERLPAAEEVQTAVLPLPAASAGGRHKPLPGKYEPVCSSRCFQTSCAHPRVAKCAWAETSSGSAPGAQASCLPLLPLHTRGLYSCTTCGSSPSPSSGSALQSFCESPSGTHFPFAFRLSCQMLPVSASLPSPLSPRFRSQAPKGAHCPYLPVPLAAVTSPHAGHAAGQPACPRCRGGGDRGVRLQAVFPLVPSRGSP